MFSIVIVVRVQAFIVIVVRVYDFIMIVVRVLVLYCDSGTRETKHKKH